MAWLDEICVGEAKRRKQGGNTCDPKYLLAIFHLTDAESNFYHIDTEVFNRIHRIYRVIVSLMTNIDNKNHVHPDYPVKLSLCAFVVQTSFRAHCHHRDLRRHAEAKRDHARADAAGDIHVLSVYDGVAVHETFIIYRRDRAEDRPV